MVLFATLFAASVSSLQAQSLAEAAEKEAARRKEVKGSGRVITNKDLPQARPPTPSAPDQAAPPATSAPTTSTADSASAAPGPAEAKDDRAPKDDADGGKRDEKYWRDRLALARKDVENSQVLVAALQSRINALTTDFVNRDDPAQRAVIATDREKAIAELENYRKATLDGARAIGAIEEEARRAGVPPGWLR
jgi:hypothetical protein